MMFSTSSEEAVYDLSLQLLIDTLSFYGLTSDPQTHEGLSSLLRYYSQGICGNLPPFYFLSSLDPGSGKTESISSFIKAWKSLGLIPQGSILIGVNTKDQIASLVKRLNLDARDFACFTKDDTINALGLGSDKRHEAPVLITTQQMIVARTKDRTFSSAKDFFYKEGPRSLRIWDESFLQAEPVTIRATALHALAGQLTMLHRSFADDLTAFANKLASASDGESFVMDPHLAGMARSVLAGNNEEGHWGRPTLPLWQVQTLEALVKGGGRDFRLWSYGGLSSLALVGSSKPLPTDFAPAIILDASGRVRGTYELWQHSGGNLVRLPTKANDYRNLHLRLWQTASGKDALRDEEINRAVFRSVAEAIMTRPDEEWLIIGSKPTDHLNILDLVQQSVPEPTHDKLHFVHWGVHTATNAYNHIRNVVVIGSYDYGNTGYDGLAAAATGSITILDAGNGTGPLRLSEYKHNVLQGIMRSNARNAKDGIAGECNAYVIVSRSIPKSAFEEAFPGCRLTIWKEAASTLTGQAKALVDIVTAHFNDPAAGPLKKSVVVAALGCHKKSLSGLLAKSAVRNTLANRGITWTHTRFALV